MGDSPGSSTILNFIPFTSFIETTFWYKLSEIKLDNDKLEEKSRNIFGYINHNSSCKLYVNNNSFGSSSNLDNFDYLGVGTLLNLNSLEAFKSYDKTQLLNTQGKELIRLMENDEIFNDLKLLTKFFILTFADLKKYHFYYWVCYPAPAMPTYKLVSSQILTSVFSDSEIASLFEEQSKLDSSQQIYFGVQKLSGGKCKVYELREFVKILNKDNFERDKTFLVFSDPSNYETYAGWSLRNLLYLINVKCPKCLVDQNLSIICLRNKKSKMSTTPNIILNIHISPSSDTNPNSSGTGEIKFVGWEKNERGKFGPRFVSLRESMDPARLAASSIDLNLKLMKWRLMPDLNLDILKNTKCLLLGAGTLGCNVARALIAWGVTHITFVDNGEVSYSNPARQSLYTFNDCSKKKATVAAQMLTLINPSIKSEGIVMGIPMPGHTGIDSENASKLYDLINKHDVTFLLTDSRESRWLPTLICATLNKLAITTALGFDTYLVLRHGVYEDDSNNSNSKTKLGCYFCNDVTAPGNSQTDRTLDQQCTVTRPGVSAIAGSLAVEILVSLLQHSKKSSVSSDETCCLGSIPHSIRGFLAQYQIILPATPSFNQCTACSDKIISEYKLNQENFLSQVFKSSKYLEDITGLTQLYKKTEEAEADIWDFEDPEED